MKTIVVLLRASKAESLSGRWRCHGSSVCILCGAESLVSIVTGPNQGSDLSGLSFEPVPSFLLFDRNRCWSVICFLLHWLINHSCFVPARLFLRWMSPRGSGAMSSWFLEPVCAKSSSIFLLAVVSCLLNQFFSLSWSSQWICLRHLLLGHLPDSFSTSRPYNRADRTSVFYRSSLVPDDHQDLDRMKTWRFRLCWGNCTVCGRTSLEKVSFVVVHGKSSSFTHLNTDVRSLGPSLSL